MAGRFAAADAFLKKFFFTSIGLGSLALGVGATCYVVPPGHRALHFSRFGGGILPDEKQEGLNFKLPWFQIVHMLDVRIQPHTITTDTSTKDLQTVRISLRVLHRPKLGSLAVIFNSIGKDYAETIFRSISNEVLKARVAEFNAEELVTCREEIASQLTEHLIERAAHFNVELKDVSITNIEFSPEFSAAIEAKQVEQQRAEAQKWAVEYSKYMAQAAVIRVEGESYASRVTSQAMALSPDYLELKRIQTAKEIARILASSRNVVYLPPSTNVLMTL